VAVLVTGPITGSGACGTILSVKNDSRGHRDTITAGPVKHYLPPIITPEFQRTGAWKYGGGMIWRVYGTKLYLWNSYGPFF